MAALKPNTPDLPQSHTPEAEDADSADSADSSSSSSSFKDKESFTMIVLDFDDTLVPTTIRRMLLNNFKIDLFKLRQGKRTLIKQLQIDIISSLVSIRDKCNNVTQIALVSNGSPSWLKQMFSMPLDSGEDEKDGNIFQQLVASGGNNNNYKKDKIKLNTMSKYFIKNNVSIHSTTREMKDNNKKQKGKNKKFLIKYKTIKRLINEKSKELNMPCTQVISVGDGKYEKEAIQKYSNKYGIRCIHFGLIKAPSLDQLDQQWSMIEKANFEALSSEKTQFFVFEMNEVLPNDNHEECTGTSHQLPAISQYFRYWLKSLNIQNGKKASYASQSKLNSLAQAINGSKATMIAKKKYKHSHYEKIVNALCVVHPPLKKTIKKNDFEW
eukprot:9494_1